MGQTIPRQHPAVVLRSHYVQLRMLLAIALCAVVALAATVVILAVDESSTGSASPGVQVTKVGTPGAVGAEMQQRRDAVHGTATPAPGDTRYDGGPDEGTRGVTGGTLGAPRYDGGPDEGTRGIVTP